MQLDSAYRDMPIEELDLSVRAYNILRRMDVRTFQDLASLTLLDLNAYATGGGVPFGPSAFRNVAEMQNDLHTYYTRAGN